VRDHGVVVVADDAVLAAMQRRQ
jgi:hypothetical protein